jgi:hypothetical protein
LTAIGAACGPVDPNQRRQDQSGTRFDARANPVFEDILAAGHFTG